MLLVYAIIASGGNTIGVVATFFCLLQVLGPVSGGHMNPAVTFGVFVREYSRENLNMLWKIVLGQFMGALAGSIFALDHLESVHDKWRRVHPVAKVPIEWMPTVCPIDPITNLCQSSDRGL